MLIDVDDVGLGHMTKLRWNDSDKWVWSKKIVQPPIIDKPTFDRVQLMISGRATQYAEHKPHRAQHPYALRGCVWCGLCGRRMQGHWVSDITYYRCRFAAEYALANHVEHPLSVYLREDAIIGEVDGWVAREFAPHRLSETIRDLAAVQPPGTATRPGHVEETARKIAECDGKLAQYRAALDAGADPRIVAAWITETEAEKARYQLSTRPAATARRMSEAEIKSIVDRLADIARALRDANPEDKAEVFRQLDLKLTHQPGTKIVQAQIQPSQFGFFDS